MHDFLAETSTDGLWQTTAKYVPALVVFGLLTLGILYWMSRLINTGIEAFQERDKQFLDAEGKKLEGFQSHNEKREGAMLGVIERNTEALLKNAEVIGKFLQSGSNHHGT